MTNYYELLEISQNASKEEIEKAIHKVRRLWNTRSTNPNAEIRVEAEQKIRSIAEAERILLDPAQRREYDIQLIDFNSKRVLPVPDNEDEDNWLDLAIEYDERKDYSSLSQLMEKVTRQYPNNAQAWIWRGLASQYQERYTDAEYEVKKAISFMPNNAAYHAVLGDIYLDLDQTQNAEIEYRRALELEPSNNDYKLSVAMTLGMEEKYEEALKFSSEVFKVEKDNERAQHLYTLSLYNSTMKSISYNKTLGDYVITNEAQLVFLKGKLPLFDAIPKNNSDVKDLIEKVHKIVKDAETSQFRKSDRMATYIVAFIVGFVCLCSGSSTAILGVIICVLVVAVYIYRHNMPGWKWQQRLAGEDTKRSGIQS